MLLKNLSRVIQCITEDKTIKKNQIKCNFVSLFQIMQIKKMFFEGQF